MSEYLNENIELGQGNKYERQVKIQKWADFECYLMKIRMSLNPDTNSAESITQFIDELFRESLNQIHNDIAQLLNFVQLNSQPQKISSGQQKSNDKKQIKSLLYYFQLLNLILINLNNKQVNYKNLFNMHKIIDIIRVYTQNQQRFYQKTFKSLLIFYFNLLKKLSLFAKQQQNAYNVNNQGQNKSLNNELFVFQILDSILECYFMGHSKAQTKSQTSFKQQTQWIGLIIELLPQINWQTMFSQSAKSFIQNYFRHLQTKYNKGQYSEVQNRKKQYKLLHMIGNFINHVIQGRTTTQLIKGYQCQIKDVKQMYSKPSTNKLCHMKLNSYDLDYLITIFKQYYREEKLFFNKLFLNKQQSVQKAYDVPQQWLLKSQQQVQIDSEFKQKLLYQGNVTIGQLLLENINIINSVLFLGGYSPKIQLFIFKQLFQSEILPEFLELAFILYNQKRFMGKNSPKVILAKPPDANLSKILQVGYQNISQNEKQAIYKLIAEQIKFGQLSTLLRLLTNLVHINKEALQYFQNNVKYLHMIMSLTHESQMNLTMKNWAVLFIKNCCDSQKLRQQISKIKIQMKVDK